MQELKVLLQRLQEQMEDHPEEDSISVSTEVAQALLGLTRRVLMRYRSVVNLLTGSADGDWDTAWSTLRQEYNKVAEYDALQALRFEGMPPNKHVPEGSLLDVIRAWRAECITARRDRVCTQALFEMGMPEHEERLRHLLDFPTSKSTIEVTRLDLIALLDNVSYMRTELQRIKLLEGLVATTEAVYVPKNILHRWMMYSFGQIDYAWEGITESEKAVFGSPGVFDALLESVGLARLLMVPEAPGRDEGSTQRAFCCTCRPGCDDPNWPVPKNER